MSNDFKKVLVKDDRLMVTDSLNYAVCKGGQNVTNVRMPAISATPNALNFVVPFPSESTLLDREVYLRTQTDYYITFATALTGVPQFYSAPVANVSTPTYVCPLVYAYNIGINSFPTQRTMDTIQVQLNNNISTINSADVLPALLRCSDAVQWERYNMTGANVASLQTPDEDLVCGINNSIGGYDLSQGNKFIGNGSFDNILYPLDPITPVNNDGTPNILTQYDQAGTRFFVLRVQSCEPLIAPPFIWNKTLSNRMGIYGLQNMSIVCNYGYVGNAINITTFAGIAETISTYAGTPTALPIPTPSSITQVVNNAELQMKYITPHSTDIMAQRNVIPYLEYPRFITSTLNAVPNATLTNALTTGSYSELTLGTSVLQSQTFTLNQVPDKLIIFVRTSSIYRNNPNYHDFALPIQGITIQWNNHAGILANASQEQLFHMSQEAGSNQDWLEFTGVANINPNRSTGNAGFIFSTRPYDNGGTAGPTPVGQSFGPVPAVEQVSTIGSYLMLDLAKHLELNEAYYAPGSLGSFQIQFAITVNNQNTIALGGVASVTPEIVLIPVNSGLMVTERGQTSCFTGILTKADVLEASLQEPLSHMQIMRVVGHGHQDGGRALPKHILPGATRSKMEPASHSANMSRRLM